MHLTHHLVDELPSMRRAEVLEKFRALLAGAKQRGVRTVAYVLMGNHLHWMIVPESREALRNATCYVFRGFAKWFNSLLGRTGSVFNDRYHSTVGRSVRQAFQMLAYLIKNPRAAGYAPGPGDVDRFLGVNEPLVGSHPFLRSVFGPLGPPLRELLWRMVRGPVAFVPVRTRLQLPLPGFS